MSKGPGQQKNSGYPFMRIFGVINYLPYKCCILAAKMCRAEMDQLAKENAALKQQVQAMVLKLKQAEQMNGGEPISLAMGIGVICCLL